MATFCKRILLFAITLSIPVISTSGLPNAIAESPEHRIDRYIIDQWDAKGIRPANPATDAQWVRRVYLDLAGRIPKASERDAFVRDKSSDKREQLVDHLLASEDYAQHFADIFDALLMGRTTESNYQERVKHHWRGYLESVFRKNRPWDQVTNEILLGRPSGDHDRGASWFLFERKDKHQEIAEAVAPAFFGLRIECAQCHDHMMADEIEQAHYWGLVAFFNRSKNKHTPNGPRVSESAIGGFSDFADIHGSSSPNLLSFIDAHVIEEKRPGKDDNAKDEDDLYLAPAQKNNPRVPKFSRRSKFVEEVVSNHPRIAPSLVNRVWAMLMGRGLVHPYDKMDSVHPPSHPDLLNWLVAGFEYSGFDIRKLVRTIVLTDTYALSSRKPDGVDDPATFAWYLERPLTAEQWGRSIQVAVRDEFQNDHQIVRQLRQHIVDVLPETIVTTAKDTLFLSNHNVLIDFLAESDQESHLINKIQNVDDIAKGVGLAFQTIYGRPADPAEQKRLAIYLRAHNDKKAIENMIWAMLTSAEFRLNH